MSKELRIGIAAAAIGTAAIGAAKAIESKPIEVTIEPGECKVVLEDVARICNGLVINDNQVYIHRLVDEKWILSDYADLFLENEPVEMEEMFDGMSLYRDEVNRLHIKVENPLLKATPFPTTIPTPKPIDLKNS